jgi:hypothetical protein
MDVAIVWIVYDSRIRMQSTIDHTTSLLLLAAASVIDELQSAFDREIQYSGCGYDSLIDLLSR